jgi:hypothetical protein
MSEVATLMPDDGDPLPPPTNGKANTAQPKPKMSGSSSTPYNPPPADGGRNLEAKLKAKKTGDGSQPAASKKQQSEIPVRTPDKKWWFRAHPDPAYTLPVDILVLDDGPNEGLYFLDPDVEMPDELSGYMVPAMITLCITSDGTLFFYLAKQSAKSPKASTRRVLHEAKSRWIQQQWNAAAKSYDWTPASKLRRAPVWPTKSVSELLEMAFGDNFLSDPNHPVISMLINPHDDDQADYEAEQGKDVEQQ